MRVGERKCDQYITDTDIPEVLWMVSEFLKTYKTETIDRYLSYASI